MTDTATTTEIADWIVERIDFYGNIPSETFTVDSPIEELGLDSIYAMALLADIEDRWGVALEVSVFEDLASIRALADIVAGRLAAP